MRNREKQIADLLLQSNAIKLNPAKPFQWSSGWKSPIYCDNRKTLSHPDIRTFIKNEFVGLLKEKFGAAEAIAGVATGAIAQGAMVADALNLPYLYVRSSPKAHGMENLIEGEPQPGQLVVVVEDLVSTGRSSLSAVSALRNAGCNVLGMMAIFTYGFEVARKSFAEAGCILYTLSSYDILLEQASKTGYIQPSQVAMLREWKTDPQHWGSS